ncbi:MAG: WD40 repeat domain-containing protein, partial [Anaerolineales bacterium]|nr:WD40 repeat domain-containing protein [Anaerolineales bacterium]
MPHRRLTLLALLTALTGLVLAGASAAVAARSSPPPTGETVIELAVTGVDRANALAYSPDGRWLAVGASTGLLLYDARTLAEQRFIPTGAWVRSLAFSADGQLLATGSYDEVVRLWRVADGVLARELVGHAGWVRSVAFSPDGAALVSASDDDSVRVWRVSDGAPQQVLTQGLDGVRAVAFSPDGATLATGGYDNVVRLWRAGDGALLRELVGHTDWVRCLAFSPDGTMLASGGFDPTIRLWRVADGALVGKLAGHTSSVLSLAFSPDGAVLASGSVDTRVRLWRVADGAAVGLLTGHNDFVFAVAFAPDGQTLASGAVDNTLRLWPVGTLATAAPLPADVDPTNPANASCVTCHHPRGDVQRPGGLAQPPRVAEMVCATCHQGGALVFNWCPAFPRSPGASGLSAVAVTGDASGVWHGSRDVSVVLGAPANGAHVYASYLLTAMPVSGHVYAPEADLAEVKLQLEIWSGAERIALSTTSVQADGSFYFVTNLSPQGIPIEVPIEKRDCEMCHGDEIRDAPALPTGALRLVVTALGADGPLAFDERWIVVDRGQLAAASVAVVSEEDGQPVAELPVQAAARLYAWRGRAFAGTTDET